MFLPFTLDFLFFIHSSSFLIFLSKVDLIPSQLSSKILIHKPFLSSSFLLPVPPYISKHQASCVSEGWGEQRALPDSCFRRVQWHTLISSSLSTFIKGFTYCHNLFSLLWHNSLKSEFSQTHLLVLLLLFGTI